MCLQLSFSPPLIVGTLYMRRFACPSFRSTDYALQIPGESQNCTLTLCTLFLCTCFGLCIPDSVRFRSLLTSCPFRVIHKHMCRRPAFVEFPYMLTRFRFEALECPDLTGGTTTFTSILLGWGVTFKFSGSEGSNKQESGRNELQ